MTESEARTILQTRLEKRKKHGEKIWIGQGRSHGNLGFSFKAGTCRPGSEIPDNPTTWAVDAKTKRTELMLLQLAD